LVIESQSRDCNGTTTVSVGCTEARYHAVWETTINAAWVGAREKVRIHYTDPLSPSLYFWPWEAWARQVQ